MAEIPCLFTEITVSIAFVKLRQKNFFLKNAIRLEIQITPALTKILEPIFVSIRHTNVFDKLSLMDVGYNSGWFDQIFWSSKDNLEALKLFHNELRKNDINFMPLLQKITYSDIGHNYLSNEVESIHNQLPQLEVFKH